MAETKPEAQAAAADCAANAVGAAANTGDANAIADTSAIKQAFFPEKLVIIVILMLEAVGEMRIRPWAVSPCHKAMTQQQIMQVRAPLLDSQIETITKLREPYCVAEAPAARLRFLLSSGREMAKTDTDYLTQLFKAKNEKISGHILE